MLDPSKMTVSDLFTTVRDIAFFTGFIIAIWKARGAVQPAIDFFKDAKVTMVRAREHMDKVEEGLGELQDGVAVLLANHLPHLQHRLDHIYKQHQHLQKHLRISDIIAESDFPGAETVSPYSGEEMIVLAAPAEVLEAGPEVKTEL